MGLKKDGLKEAQDLSPAPYDRWKNLKKNVLRNRPSYVISLKLNLE